ncbi:hypothetical protein [Streptomyces sp. HUAS TT20]|uniref:hypothetical protein n=1 Tax=Streptomyces sp. HUAS TT20 TaxID=3447509 RepID=UPI0021D87D7D|nr:hypothetical protein [Streptomyces sp. HUAS 15-9]UXY30996.1 hypothetical protein N8I87_33550 [Streptomyces sp. HUAS 15-9]
MRRTARALPVAALAAAALGIAIPTARADPAAEVSPGSVRPGDSVTVAVTCDAVEGTAPETIDASSPAFEGGTVRLRRVTATDGRTAGTAGTAYRGTARIASGEDGQSDADAAGQDAAGTAVDGTCPGAAGARGQAWSAEVSMPRADVDTDVAADADADGTVVGPGTVKGADSGAGIDDTVPCDDAKACGASQACGDDQGRECGQSQPAGDGRETSTDGRKTSGDGRETSGDGRETSGDGRETSGDGRETSGDGHESSGDGHESSGDGRESSGDGWEPSGDGRQCGESGQSGGASCSDGGRTCSESRGDSTCGPAVIQQGVDAGEGGAFNGSVPVLVVGGLLIAGALGAAVHRLVGDRERAGDG